MRKLLIICLSFLFVFSTAGPNIGGTASDAGGGTPINGVWANPMNAQSENGVSATNATLQDADLSNYLQIVNFGFSVTAGSAIVSITDEAKMSSTSIGDGFDFNIFSCIGIKSGADDGDDPLSNPLPVNGLVWQQINATPNVTYGSTWTAVDVNASTSGLKLQLNNTDPNGLTISVDAFRRTVVYTPPSTSQRRLVGQLWRQVSEHGKTTVTEVYAYGCWLSLEDYSQEKHF